MISQSLPSIEEVKLRYEINFEEYGIILFHPVTTEFEKMKRYSKQLVDALFHSNRNFVVIYPNNDLGSSDILNEYKRFENNQRFKIFPSIRFEFFLVLLKYAKCIVGNSSAGIREAPYYGLATVNIGNRQQNRAMHNDIFNCSYESEDIASNIERGFKSEFNPISLYGDGNSDILFIKAISSPSFWEISKQKQFNDLKNG
jgi:UDP-N-acetylglucosamine 2-epimerase (hydrolysing)